MKTKDRKRKFLVIWFVSTVPILAAQAQKHTGTGTPFSPFSITITYHIDI